MVAPNAGPFYLVCRKVSDADLAVEGDQVVLAQGEELDVLDNHHFVCVLFENALKSIFGKGYVRSSIFLKYQTGLLIPQFSHRWRG